MFSSFSSHKSFHYYGTSLVAQTVRRLSTMRETRVRALGWEDPLEKEMAIHSGTVAWKIPWMQEPRGLQSMGSLRVGHDWVTSLSVFTFMHWRRKWQPTPMFLPGESQGLGNLVGCHLWGRTESDATEATWQQQVSFIYFCFDFYDFSPLTNFGFCLFLFF